MEKETTASTRSFFERGWMSKTCEYVENSFSAIAISFGKVGDVDNDQKDN